MNTPVVLFIYNRAATTRRVMAVLQQLRPTQLFVVADGPRSITDAERCAEARAAVDDNVDWPCRVVRDYSAANLGPQRRVAGGLTSVFRQVEAAIILEDDCLPQPDFFTFCEELLRRFHDDERVMMISGTNPLLRWRATHQSYHFSHHGMIWGWATWRRAWQHYDNSMASLSDPAAHSQLRAVLQNDLAYDLCIRLYRQVQEGRVHTWDYSWLLTMQLRDGLTVVPAVNLVANIGFGRGATHTKQAIAMAADLPTAALELPMLHPQNVAVDREYDRLWVRWMAGDPDPQIVITHVQHALAADQPLRALLLIDALNSTTPATLTDPMLQELRGVARQAVEVRRLAHK